MKYLDENGLLYVIQKIKGWLGEKADASALNNKVDKVSGKGLSTNDYTTAEKNKLAGIASGAEVNVQSDWNETNTSSDAYIKNKPTIPAGAKLYSSTGQNTDGAMTQKAITDALGNIVGVKFEVVTSLPATGDAGTIYLKAHTHGTGDIYDEYIYVNSAWEKIGTTDIDLSDYVDSDTFNIMLAEAFGNINATPAGWNNGYRSYTTSEYNKLAGIAAGAEVNVQSDWNATSGDAFIKNKPSIPTESTVSGWGFTKIEDMTSITNAEIDTICS